MRRLYLLLLCLLCLSASLKAQSIGLFSSLKGFGISYYTGNEEKSDVFTAYADTYGMWHDRTCTPGVKLLYNHCTPFFKQDFSESRLYLSAGPGVALGYVHDFDRGVNSINTLQHNMGISASLTCRLACMLYFPGKAMSVDFSLLLEAGMHLRKDEIVVQNNLALYRNGLYQALYPQISIYFDL